MKFKHLRNTVLYTTIKNSLHKVHYFDCPLHQYVQSIFLNSIANQTWNFELLPLAIRNDWWMLWIFEFFFNFYYDANFFQNCQITFPKTELVSLLWCVLGKDRAVGSELNNSIYNKFLPILVTFSSFLWFESSCDSWIRFSVSLSIPHLLF